MDKDTVNPRKLVPSRANILCKAHISPMLAIMLANHFVCYRFPHLSLSVSGSICFNLINILSLFLFLYLSFCPSLSIFSLYLSLTVSQSLSLSLSSYHVVKTILVQYDYVTRVSGLCSVGFSHTVFEFRQRCLPMG